MSTRRATIPKHSDGGVIVSTPLDSDKKTESPMMCCIHCGIHWAPRPGSGTRRGFCTRCNGFVCGRAACVAWGCFDRDRVCDNIEAGLPINFRPIIVSVSGG